MSRIAYIDGQYRRLHEPSVFIEDRAYQFSDGIYEVCLVVGGVYCDEEGHLARMRRSLKELGIAFTMSDNSLKFIMGEVLRRNRLRDALVYIQISRGVAPRNHAFPVRTTSPVLVMTAKPFSKKANDQLAQKGVEAISYPDIRWGRVDIKSVSLLPNVMAKQAASEAGAFESILVRNEKITEGSSTNVWILDQDDRLITHPLSHEILGGITRATLMKAAEVKKIEVVERVFSLKEAYSAKELFLSSATAMAMPVIKLDGKSIGMGKPGSVCMALRESYIELSTL